MITRTVPVIYETDQLGCFNGNFKSYRRDNCTDGTSENSTNSWASAANTITEQISEQELSIPCHQAMTGGEVEAVVTALNRFAGK